MYDFRSLFLLKNPSIIFHYLNKKDVNIYCNGRIEIDNCFTHDGAWCLDQYAAYADSYSKFMIEPNLESIHQNTKYEIDNYDDDHLFMNTVCYKCYGSYKPLWIDRCPICSDYVDYFVDYGIEGIVCCE